MKNYLDLDENDKKLYKYFRAIHRFDCCFMCHVTTRKYYRNAYFLYSIPVSFQWTCYNENDSDYNEGGQASTTREMVMIIMIIIIAKEEGKWWW